MLDDIDFNGIKCEYPINQVKYTIHVEYMLRVSR